MRKKIASALGDILAGHKERETTRRRRIAVEMAAQERFRSRWDRKVEGTVQPVFEEFRLRLEEDRHLCRIKIEELSGEGGKRHLGEAAIYVVPARLREEVLVERDTPSLRFELDTHREIVLLSKCTVMGKRGGTEGLHGEYDMKAVTRQLVEEKLLGLIEQVFTASLR